MTQSLFDQIKSAKADLGEKANDTLGVSESFLKKKPTPTMSVVKGFGFVLKDGLGTSTKLGNNIEGILLEAEPKFGVSKAYYAKDFDGSTSKPDCFSRDGVNPLVENPVHVKCVDCPRNNWDDNKVKKCNDYKSLKFLHFQGEENAFVTMRLSGTSITQLTEYALPFLQNEFAIWKVLTEISVAWENDRPTISFSLKGIFAENQFDAMENKISQLIAKSE